MKFCGCLRRILVSVTILVAMFCVTAPVVAEEVPEQRIQMTPAKLVFELKPGETVTETFQVQNTGSRELKYKLSVAPYSAIGEDYASDFATETKYTDIVKWATLSRKEGSIEPSSSDEVTVTIAVPEDVPAGGQYASILAQVVDDDKDGDNSGVTIKKQLGLLVYASVDGETRKEASVVENKIAGFLFEPPISGTSVVENKGNVHLEATYTLQVYPFFSDEEVYTNEEHPDVRTILPETRRYNQVVWENAPQLGVFRVKQTVKVLDQESVTEKMVFLCPVWFLFIIILIVFCLVFWIISHFRERKI